MNKDEFIRYVSSELEHGRDIDLEYQINGITIGLGKSLVNCANLIPV